MGNVDRAVEEQTKTGEQRKKGAKGFQGHQRGSGSSQRGSGSSQRVFRVVKGVQDRHKVVSGSSREGSRTRSLSDNVRGVIVHLYFQTKLLNPSCKCSKDSRIIAKG